MNNIGVTSEVGRLRAVLLHRPGRELESLTPQYLDSMLFEDIPYLEHMQYEHDQFADLLRKQGCTVYYIEQLLNEVFSDNSLRTSAISYLVDTSQLFSPSLKESIRLHLEHASTADFVSYCIGGLLKSDIDDKVRHKTLSYYIRDAYPYYIAPLPNLYFTRDPATVVGSSVAIHTMKTEARRRENWLLSLIAQHHPLFASYRIHSDYSHGSSIEGGDVLILNDSCAAVGSSARTDVWAIEAFAKRILSPPEVGGEGMQEVLVIQIPYTRAYMHLDTVLTMVDVDTFSLYGGVASALRIFSMTLGRGNNLRIQEETNFQDACRRILRVPAVRILHSGGNDKIVAAREQWNDSTNTLAIAPGKVVTYKRNTVSNDLLERHGISVLPIDGSELVRGRGGPRCMSMPLVRESL
jgi:arginine deiminase